MSEALQTYRDLQVWQEAVELAVAVYHGTQDFPSEEVFGLTSQMRRAAVSVPSNIAEGYGREHRKEYRHHLSISRGSLMELETQLIISERLGYLGKDKAKELWKRAQVVGRLLNGLFRSLGVRRNVPAREPRLPAPEPRTPNPEPRV